MLGVFKCRLLCRVRVIISIESHGDVAIPSLRADSDCSGNNIKFIIDNSRAADIGSEDVSILIVLPVLPVLAVLDFIGFDILVSYGSRLSGDGYPFDRYRYAELDVLVFVTFPCTPAVWPI